MVRVEFTVCPGSQPKTLQNIETDDGLVDITKLGMKNSVIGTTVLIQSVLITRQPNPQFDSQVFKRLRCVYLFEEGEA